MFGKVDKRKDVIYIVIIFMIVFVLTTIFDYMKNKNSYNFVTSINPKIIILRMNDKYKKLSGAEASKFLEYLKARTVSAHHSHSIIEYSVSVAVTSAENKTYLFSIEPDSDIVGEYWVSSSSPQLSFLRQIRSPWLKDLFKEINFFDHAVIIEKSN